MERKTEISSETKSVSKATNQWVLINQELRLYRCFSYTLVAITLIAMAITFFEANRNPIVISNDNQEKRYFEGRRQPVKITDDDVKATIEDWITLRYTWEAFDAEKIIRNISPLTTEGLREKLKDTLEKQSAHSPKEQQLEEQVSRIQVVLGQSDAEAHFDLVMRINGIPLIVPSEITIQVIQGSATRWNERGLYINGVIEHEQK
jgi:hypothetical protein